MADTADAAPSHADLARLVDEAREALEGTRTAPSDLTQPQPAAQPAQNASPREAWKARFCSVRNRAIWSSR